MSVTALWIVYHHYQADYKWATELDTSRLQVGQVGYWQYEASVQSKHLYASSKRRSRRLSEFEKGPWVEDHRVAQSWSLVIADNTVILVQTSPSRNITYGSPMQRLLETFIEPNPPKYQVQAIRPDQTAWLQSMQPHYPDYAVQSDLVLVRLNYPRTTVLFSLPFVILACGALVLVSMGLYHLGQKTMARAISKPGDPTKVNKPIHLRQVELISAMALIIYLAALQYLPLG